MYPLVSIIIPLYNKERTISQTIESITNQTFKNFEVVVVNDGSTDNSVSEVLNIDDRRIRLINQPNGGVSNARNTGISNALGRWLMFLDADDKLLSNALEILVNNIDAKCSIIAANFLVKNQKGQISKFLINTKRCNYTPKNIFKNIFLGRFFMRAGSFIISAELAKRECFKSGLSRYEDMEVFIRWWDNSEILYIPKEIMVYQMTYAEASKPLSDVYKDYGFHLEFSHNNFWKNCILGEILNITIHSYIQQERWIKQKYSNNIKWMSVSKILLLYKRLIGKINR